MQVASQEVQTDRTIGTQADADPNQDSVARAKIQAKRALREALEPPRRSGELIPSEILDALTRRANVFRQRFPALREFLSSKEQSLSNLTQMAESLLAPQQVRTNGEADLLTATEWTFANARAIRAHLVKLLDHAHESSTMSYPEIMQLVAFLEGFTTDDDRSFDSRFTLVGMQCELIPNALSAAIGIFQYPTILTFIQGKAFPHATQEELRDVSSPRLSGQERAGVLARSCPLAYLISSRRTGLPFSITLAHLALAFQVFIDRCHGHINVEGEIEKRSLIGNIFDNILTILSPPFQVRPGNHVDDPDNFDLFSFVAAQNPDEDQQDSPSIEDDSLTSSKDTSEKQTIILNALAQAVAQSVLPQVEFIPDNSSFEANLTVKNPDSDDENARVARLRAAVLRTALPSWGDKTREPNETEFQQIFPTPEVLPMLLVHRLVEASAVQEMRDQGTTAEAVACALNEIRAYLGLQPIDLKSEKSSTRVPPTILIDWIAASLPQPDNLPGKESPESRKQRAQKFLNQLLVDMIMSSTYPLESTDSQTLFALVESMLTRAVQKGNTALLINLWQWLSSINKTATPARAEAAVAKIGQEHVSIRAVTERIQRMFVGQNPEVIASLITTIWIHLLGSEVRLRKPKARVGGEQLIQIIGPSGSGKTAIAKAALEQMAGLLPETEIIPVTIETGGLVPSGIVGPTFMDSIGKAIIAYISEKFGISETRQALEYFESLRRAGKTRVVLLADELVNLLLINEGNSGLGGKRIGLEVTSLANRAPTVSLTINVDRDGPLKTVIIDAPLIILTGSMSTIENVLRAINGDDQISNYSIQQMLDLVVNILFPTIPDAPGRSYSVHFLSNPDSQGLAEAFFAPEGQFSCLPALIEVDIKADPETYPTCLPVRIEHDSSFQNAVMAWIDARRHYFETGFAALNSLQRLLLDKILQQPNEYLIQQDEEYVIKLTDSIITSLGLGIVVK